MDRPLDPRLIVMVKGFQRAASAIKEVMSAIKVAILEQRLASAKLITLDPLN